MTNDSVSKRSRVDDTPEQDKTFELGVEWHFSEFCVPALLMDCLDVHTLKELIDDIYDFTIKYGMYFWYGLYKDVLANDGMTECLRSMSHVFSSMHIKEFTLGHKHVKNHVEHFIHKREAMGKSILTIYYSNWDNRPKSRVQPSERQRIRCRYHR